MKSVSLALYIDKGREARIMYLIRGFLGKCCSFSSFSILLASDPSGVCGKLEVDNFDLVPQLFHAKSASARKLELKSPLGPPPSDTTVRCARRDYSDSLLVQHCAVWPKNAFTRAAGKSSKTRRSHASITLVRQNFTRGRKVGPSRPD